VQSTLARYAIAVGCVANAFFVRWILGVSLGEELPYATFMLAVCASVWLAGTGPSVVATALSVGLANWFFIAPRQSFWISDPGDIVRLPLFVLACAIVIRIGDTVRTAGSRSSEAESKVRVQEETLRSTLASIRDAIIRTDSAGRVTYFNPVAEVWTGRSTLDAAGRRVWDFIPELTQSEAVAGPLFEQERYLPSIGRWVRTTVTPASDGGRVIALGDISDRRQFDRLQLGQQAVLERIALGAPLTEVLGRICQLIEEHEPGLACSILLVDRKQRRTMSGVGPSLDPQFVKALENIIIEQPYVGSCCAALDSGVEIVVPDVAADCRWSDVWRDLNLSYGLRACRSVPVFGGAGEVVASVAIFRRTAGDPGPRNRLLLGIATHLIGIAVEKNRAEARIRSSQDRTRLLWEAATILLTADEPDSMLKAMFAKIAWHLRLDAFLNYTVTETGEELALRSQSGLEEEVAESIRRLQFGQAICGRVAVSKEPCLATSIQTSSEPAWSLVRSLGFQTYFCSPLLVGNELLGTLSFASRTRESFDEDEIDFLATISKYVTAAYERLSLIARLQEADRRKDQFLATLAHELRNPLAPLQNGLLLLDMTGGQDPDSAEVRSMMSRQLAQMVRLIDDLMDISRITRGKVSLRKERVEIQAAIRQALETVGPIVKAGEHVLATEIAPEPIYVMADLTRLSQVIANLLNNACKYTNRGGRIVLGLKHDGDDAVVTIRDTGVGIPPEMLPRIFDMFTQVDDSLEKSQGGLGIGLSLVKGLVELHGGTVEAKSLGTDTGSEFVIRIPAVLSVVAADEPVSIAVMPADGFRRILIVDDNQDAAKSLAAMLRMMGKETETAFDGLEGLQVASTFRPEAIFLDIGMPRMNGYDVARRLRQELWGRSALLVALTGWGLDEDRRRSQEAGFDFHLVKPVDMEGLHKVLAPRASNTA
jgi:PAS domain S-box-containing protein